jgi:TolB protein
VTEVDLTLEQVWDADRSGYLSGDHHFHLNYGGPYTLDPEDLVPIMAGEDLDVATPLLANLHNRFGNQHLWNWKRSGQLPLIGFGQEVRSHFLGHLGLLDTETLFWPWIWGPGYQVYGEDDRANAAPLGHARKQSGLGGYVHPLADRDPFASENHGNWPVLLAVDGILGTMDWLEISCLWTDELGTAEAWYRFLNLGVPIAAEAGTDVMNDYYRTMAVGTTRLYVHTGGATSFDAYWDGLREGRSFVTTGPMIEFAVDGVVHGGTVGGGRSVPFQLDLASAIPVGTVEVLVNGMVVWSESGLSAPGVVRFSGDVDLPEGGWVAARAHGGTPTWPAMNQVVFAHTSPIWIDHVGSVDAAAARRAAADLMPVLDTAHSRVPGCPREVAGSYGK